MNKIRKKHNNSWIRITQLFNCMQRKKTQRFTGGMKRAYEVIVNTSEAMRLKARLLLLESPPIALH